MTKSEIANRKSQIAVLMIGILNMVYLFCSCSGQSAKYRQYFAQGQALYEKNCSNCHQKNGTGLGLLYPPLASSDYLEKKFTSSFCLMKYGIKGEITVNGKSFNKPMPGVASLTDLELAEIGTYLSNAWGRQKGIVEVSQVNAALAQCGMK